MDIKIIRHNLIDEIMQTTDFEKLVAMYDMITSGKKKKTTVKVSENIETVVEEPVMDIPVVEIKKGVTLEEIRNSQELSNITYEEITEMVAEEEWEQSLEELLELLD